MTAVFSESSFSVIPFDSVFKQRYCMDFSLFLLYFFCYLQIYNLFFPQRKQKKHNKTKLLIECCLPSSETNGWAHCFKLLLLIYVL